MTELTIKERAVMRKGMGFNKRRNEKDFIQILEENVNPTDMAKVLEAITTELKADIKVKQDKLTAESADLD